MAIHFNNSRSLTWMPKSESCGNADTKAAFVNSWHVGGTEGRGYWGGESHSYSTGNTEPEWTDLTEILEHFCPNITFLKYKGLMSKFHSGKTGDSDYYGNESNYTYNYVFVEDLYNFLKDHDLIERAPVDDSE